MKNDTRVWVFSYKRRKGGKLHNLAIKNADNEAQAIRKAEEFYVSFNERVKKKQKYFYYGHSSEPADANNRADCVLDIKNQSNDRKRV